MYWYDYAMIVFSIFVTWVLWYRDKFDWVLAAVIIIVIPFGVALAVGSILDWMGF